MNSQLESLLNLMKNKHLLSLFLLIITTCVFLWVLLIPTADLDHFANAPFGRRGVYYTISPAAPYEVPSLWKRVAQASLAELAELKSRPLGAPPSSSSSSLRSVEAVSSSASLVGRRRSAAQRRPTEPELSQRPTYLTNTSTAIPVVASAVHSGNIIHVPAFLTSVREHVPFLQIVLHDLELRKSDASWLAQYCNASTSCSLRVFPLKQYPFHLTSLETKAYKPIIIQDMLNEFGSTFWIDITPSTYTFIHDNITNVLVRARTVGLAAWTIVEPTAAFTHPKMLSWFGTTKEKYYFHRMVTTSHLVLVNSALVHDKIVRPWVVCALDENCLQPLGAQGFGCNHARRPLFRYSGCHAYEMSAINIILGRVFNYDWSKYAVNDVIFGKVKDNETETLNYHLAQHRFFR